MADLVDDPGYAALIGTFGPSLLDTTGSRPTARQIEGAAPARIRHPRELRAIPNNAILQQLGWLANCHPWPRTRGVASAGSVPRTCGNDPTVSSARIVSPNMPWP